MPPPATIPDGPHVVVLPFPFGTHAAPLLAVVRRLEALSPATHFSFFGTEQSNAPAFKSQSADASESPNLRAHVVWNGIPEGYELTGRPQEAIEMFMKAAPGEFRKGIEAAVEESGRKVSWLVTDAFYWFASEMGIPWIAFWTAGPNSLSAHLHTDHLREALGNVPVIERDVEVHDIEDRKEDEMAKTKPVLNLMQTGETTRSNPSKLPRKCMILEQRRHRQANLQGLAHRHKQFWHNGGGSPRVDNG